MSDLVKQITAYTVDVTAQVRAKVKGVLSFTDEDVREWAGIEDDGHPVEPELLDEYATEMIGEHDDLEILDVEWWDSTDVEVTGSTTRMHAPAAFVPLPGLEGAL